MGQLGASKNKGNIPLQIMHYILLNSQKIFHVCYIMLYMPITFLFPEKFLM